MDMQAKASDELGQLYEVYGLANLAESMNAAIARRVVTVSAARRRRRNQTKVDTAFANSWNFWRLDQGVS